MKKLEITLSNLELERYDRQMLISGWKEEGQKKLKSAKVVVMGAGGLGCPASLYLAAAGVGKLIIIDKDKFELNNLNRQILGWQKDIGRFKSVAAAEKLKELNSYIEITPLILEIKEDNIHELIKNASVVVDAMDNWRTRFIINKACIEKEIPFVHAGIFGLYGQLTTIIPSKGPCLRCIIPKTPKEVATFPVLGATPAFFATLQVMETLKLIVGFEKTLTGRMLVFDGKYMDFLIINVEKRLECPICSIG
ncbi:HesA/MoeB/ThiF family protein [Candidatus Bathyarchaeota archaeon]|nr:HesA/MoeB/ThiF family protein [Candidatus Bathyarchaeota archaeon]